MMVKCVDCRHLKELPQKRLPRLCLLARPSKGGRMSEKDALIEHECSRFGTKEPIPELKNCPVCQRPLLENEFGKWCVCKSHYNEHKIPLTPRTKQKIKKESEEMNAEKKEILRKIKHRETLTESEIELFYSKEMEER